jgi:hypothetical protein
MVIAEILPNDPTTTDDALALFDACPAAETDFMIGAWHGAELPTGHPLDGLLEASGWRGKQFVDIETVRPLCLERWICADRRSRIPSCSVATTR